MKIYPGAVSLILFLLSGMSQITLMASPAKPAANRHWQFVSGANTVEASNQGIHINQKLPADTAEYASASTRLNIANSLAWKISFDVRFGTLRPSGAVVRLYKGNDIIGWVGADVWTKNMGVCTGEQNFKLVTPADTAWHHIEYDSDGKMLSVWQNGQKLGEDFVNGSPDRIFVGSSPPGKNTSSQQTEVWLRNVQEEAIPINSPPENVVTGQVKSPNQAAASVFAQPSVPDSAQPQVTSEDPKIIRDTSKDTSTATLTQTLDWITKTLLKNGKMLNHNGSEFMSYSQCDYDLSDLTLTFQSRMIFPGGVVTDTTSETPLKNMDDLDVTMKTVDSDNSFQAWYIVGINAVNKLKCVSEHTDYHDGDQLNENLEGCNFEFADKDIAVRFAKALRHAIRLSKTYKSNDPF